MAYQVVWTTPALEDLDSIAEYIAVDSPAYGSSVVARIIKESRSLSEFPLMGRIVPEFDDEVIRERIIYSYRLIYEIESDQIVILVVLHGAQLMPQDLMNRG